MPSYADVVMGRLLLQEETLSPEALWIASRDLAAAWRAGQELPLRQALMQRYLVRAVDVERYRQSAALVERAERERLFARLMHGEAVSTPEVLRGLFDEVRKGNFADTIGQRLTALGRIGPDAVTRAYERVDALLGAARRGRVDALLRLLESIGPQFDAAEARRVTQAYDLCAVSDAAVGRGRPAESAMLPRLDAPPELAIAAAAPIGVGHGGQSMAPPPPPAPVAVVVTPPGPSKGAELASAKAGGIAPEDCPIYGYEIVRELGKGAMGVVYKARHVITDRMTALKVLPLRLAGKTQYLERFKREAMALMRIDHDNVVRAYDFGGSEEYYYLALEFVEGETLDHLLKREVFLAERRALDMARQIARGLGAAAKQGIVHRDVKPENVIVQKDGVAKLVDFGIVKLTDMDEGGVTSAGTTVGTPFYISPEQARGEDDLDVRSDLYSLGITLFQLVTGKVPFTGKSQGAILVRHILEEVPDPRTMKPDVSEAVVKVVRRMTRKRREDRYASPDELEAGIAEALAALPPAGATPAAPSLSATPVPSAPGA